MSANVKQKRKEAVITRTTAPDALFRYAFGALLLALGLAAFAALFMSDGSVTLRLLKEKAGGLAGSVTWPLPFLLTLSGAMLMLSCYHVVNWRGAAFLWLLYLCVLALMTMLTYVNGVGPLMSYIRQYNMEQRPAENPESFVSYIKQSFEWGLNGRYPYCGGGALGMLLAYPAYQLFHHIFGSVFLIALGIVSLLMAFRVRVGSMIQGTSDWMEKQRYARAARSSGQEAAAPARRQRPQQPAEDMQMEAAPAGGAAYSYDTYDPQAEPVPTPQDYAAFAQTDPSSGGRFVPVGDGNTLYKEDFVLHPREASARAGEAGLGADGPSPSESSQLDDGSYSARYAPVKQEREEAAQLAAAQPVSSKPEPMTEEDFMPPARRRKTGQVDTAPTPAQAEPAAAAQPEGPVPGPTSAAQKAGKAAGEKASERPQREVPAARTASVQKPAPAPEEPAPWESDAASSEEDGLSDWQMELARVSQSVFGAKPAKVKEKKPQVVDVDPAVHMTESVRIKPSSEQVREEQKPEARLDDTPVQPVRPKENQFFSQPYNPPPISFLSEPKAVNRDESTQEDVKRAQQIERTLSTFNIQTEVREITHGPAITRFALKIAEGIKVKQVVGMLDNIALEMGSDLLRIEAPIPGTSYIGIEVPNSKVSSVTLREVLDSDAMRANHNPLVVALGKDIAGKPILCDLSRMPHLLIAGATGSGKSVCINSIVCSLLYRASPADVRLIMVDPKQVELQVYNGIPHLLIPVISDPKKASTALNWVVNEMFERYGKFSAMGVRNLEGFNKKCAKDKKLPNIVVIIDEMADLMEVCRKDVEESVRRLAALARAAGIYMVLATQRPSVDVITGVIKNNIPSRIAFTVSSGVDSRTIIDVNGAEKLLGKGDMLYQPTGASKPTRVQGCFVSDEEVAMITDNIVARYSADYNMDIQSQMDQSQDSGGKTTQDEPAAEPPEGEFNDLLNTAIRMAVEDGQTSISMLQRRLRVGYARAGRLVDEMTKKGIISEAEGSKPRKVLITREQFLEWMRENGEGSRMA